MGDSFKKELRKEFRNKLRLFSIEMKQGSDALILEKLRNCLEIFSQNWILQYGELPILGLYIPSPTEPNILDVLNWNVGRISFPYCKSSKEKVMEFCSFDEKKVDISLGGYFIKPENPVFCLPDLILVPGLAFDERGYRLGQGHGYYDMYFEQFNCMSIGLCYSWQIIKKVEVKNHDKKVKMVMTEKETLIIEKSEFL